jgi:hypothetical protein
MRLIVLAVCCVLLIGCAVFGQSDRGTITGTIGDPAGAMVPNASIEAKNSETGALYRVSSTSTGNYTLPQLPAGNYQLSVTASGFKQYLQTGITVLVAQALRIDVRLEVGAITETVTVNADATLLRTESGELSHNVTTERIDSLPLMMVGSGIRNPYNVVQVMPGGSQISGTVRVNGSPGNTQTTRIEGQDSTQGLMSNSPTMGQTGVDAVEEFAVQTSNFAAEYGQVGGGLFNLTMKSGTNTLHGSAYEYMRNEALNAQQPYVNKKSRERRHDFGFTIGGPVAIPKVYNGHDKTFFFWSFEQNRVKNIVATTSYTVPTLAFRDGDFRSLLTGKQLGIDPLKRPIMEGTIYDPKTARSVDGQIVTDPFLNNIIPKDRWDPVAAKYQTFISLPTNNAVPTSNYTPNYRTKSSTTIMTLKMDHMLSAKMKISGFWSLNSAWSPGGDGFIPPVSTVRSMSQFTNTGRLNFDYTITPTMVFHFGAGLLLLKFDDDPPSKGYDSFKELGLVTYAKIPPAFYGLNNAQGGLYIGGGNFSSSGPNANQHQSNIKPTSNANFTWARNNHTYKIGAELIIEGFPSTNYTPANGFFTFNAAQTALPYLNTTSPSGGSIGHPYASFLLGAVNDGETGLPSAFRIGRSNWGLYVQDTWKITRRLTLDYGLRWDYQPYLKESYGRIPGLGLTTPNPAAGNLPGAVVFEGYGPGRMNGRFADDYPYAIGPRLGLAYQITPKTVLRAGWGISYGKTSNLEMWTLRFGSDVRYGPASSYGSAITYLKDGAPIVPVWPDFNPGQAPTNVGSSPFITAVDHNAGRPPRMNMWSIGLQRELSKNLAAEISYVGNRGVWWPSSALLDINRLTPAILAKNGLDISKQADRDLMNSRLDSPTAINRGFKAPYAGYPLGVTVGQSLRPYPQFGGINFLWAPLGNTWYDSMQVKLTKRYSYNFDLTGAFTFQKEMQIGAESFGTEIAAVSPSVNNLNNLASNKYLSGFSQPFRFVVAANYTVPRLKANKYLSYVLRDWTWGGVLQYQSGMPIKVPAAQNNLASLLQLCSQVSNYGGCNGSTYPGASSASFANRVQGEPLFLKDLNSKFDPNKEFALNPKAWSQPAAGEFGTSTAYYSDYRYARRPSENMSLGRIFRFREGMNLQLRIEMNNVFNRIYRSNPTATNALQTQIKNNAGKPTSGFGYINTAAVASAARNGQLVARFSF